MDPVSGPQVDANVMNNPAYNTNPSIDGTQEGIGEPDHCRICRSEGTLEEPLFHPCKCSGSIKFVHQDCLMEWLQHSQKKHCELCKTPFQFTKLYDPHMPPSIPTPLFLKRLFRHLVRNIILWARGALVGFVWLGWLPWCVRWMWRGWFWIGDGGWQGFKMGNSVRETRTAPGSSEILPTSTPSMNGTSSAVGRGIIGLLMSPSLMGGKMSPVNGGATNPNATLPSDHYPNGLFFDSNPFSNLTRYQSINNIIIDTLEGQLLTALIVVSFILIFLIREWVVQQQPALAGGAPAVMLQPMDFEGDENQQPVAEADDLPLEPVRIGQGVVDQDLLDRAFGPLQGDEQGGDGEPVQAVRPRAIARIRRRRFPRNEPPILAEPEDTSFGNMFPSPNSSPRGAERYGQGFVLGGNRDVFLGNSHDGSSSENSSSYLTRPHVNREMMARAAEVRREMEEGVRSSSGVGSTGTSSAYDFGQSTDRKFQFGASHGNAYTPESGSSSGSRTPAKDRTSRYSSNVPTFRDMGYPRNSEEMDLIDMGTGWKDGRTDSEGSPFDVIDSNAEPSNPTRCDNYNSRSFTTSPIFGTNEASFSRYTGDAASDIWDTHRFDDEGDYDWRVQQGAESSLSENAKGKQPEQPIPDYWDDEEQGLEGGESAVKGKGKEKDMEGVEFGFEGEPYREDFLLEPLDAEEEDEEEDEDIEMEQLHNFGAGELSVSVSAAEVEASDSSTQPSTPTTSDSQAVPLHQQPEQVANPDGQAAQLPIGQQLANAVNGQNPEAMLQEVMQQIGDRRERGWRQIDARREQGAQAMAAAAAQPAVRGRGAGLWDWFMGDQPNAPGLNLIDNQAALDDMDTDDEAEVDGVPAAGGNEAIPPDVQQAIADEDAADDFDGIMELIGMRGPIAGLVQNAAISSVLITATVALGVAFPYVTGKIVMIILAYPILFLFVVPVTVVSFSAEFVVDSATCLLFSFLLMLDQLGRLVMKPFGYVIPAMSEMYKSTAITKLFRDWAMDGRNRVVYKLATLESTYSTIRRFPSSGVPPVSLVTRQSWSKLSMSMAWGMEKMGLSQSNQTYTLPYLQKLEARGVNVSSPVTFITSKLEKVVNLVSGIQRNATEVPTPPAFPAMNSHAEPYPVYDWSVWDRVAAVFLGYAFFTMLGAIYLQNARKRNGGPRGVEKIAVELLGQAGGVMKVVLIIGIEMFVFPLYCGLLLDAALLPLFEDATILSRIQFFADFPLTSIFVHWFVGTCYMFHFALFVSMCRKIMRTGVLYFIRDPDDPTFHPVKDVLDRPVIMQLRKIGFSAIIYGVLVLVCLGGVVWSLWFATWNVLPIHWSSNEPVLEFPVDLLFYNFFMPIAVKFFKPSDGLQTMYDWWFKRCARMLRLTSFMFGERKPDEEGHHVRRTWSAVLLRKSGDVENPVKEEETLRRVQESGVDVYFQRDGRFVRAPASDSIRREKGSAVFIPVSEENERLDGGDDPADGPTGPNSRDFQLAYIPPWFRTRIGLVVLGIWVFAAVTGIAVTIGPLLLGRFVLKQLVPDEVKLNDIYAFSVGVYIIGGILYAATKWKLARKWIRRGVRTAKDSEHLRKATRAWVVRAAKISYVFTAFAIVLPTLFALMIEFYVIIPIHTYFSSGEQHVIHFIQDWTLGVLYVKMMGRMLLLDAESPWARALRGVVARGYLDPDVKLATKCFIAPAGGFMLAALLLPLGLGFVAANTFLQNASSTTISQTYRYSYPAVFAIFLMVAGAYAMKLLVDSWKQSIKDEVYLTGERLHNHGEAGAGSPSAPVIAITPETNIAAPAQGLDIAAAGDAGFDPQDEGAVLADLIDL